MKAYISLFALLTSLSSGAKEMVLFCYYGQFNHLQLENSPPEMIPPHLCTHIVYKRAKFSRGNIVAGQGAVSYNGKVSKGMYTRVNALKKFNSNLKTILTIACCDSKNLYEFDDFIQEESEVKAFATKSAEYITKWEFDGLNMDIIRSSVGSRFDLNRFFKEIKTALDVEAKKRKKYLYLAASVTAHRDTDIQYNMKELSRYVDYFILTPFDYIRYWRIGTIPPDNVRTAPLAPMNLVTESVNYWLKEKVPAKKLLLGIATFGRTFVLEDETKSAMGSRIAKHGQPGVYSNLPGILHYYEICHNLNSKEWKEVWDNDIQAPYAFKGSQWVTYENSRTVKRKIDFVKKQGIAGVYVSDVTYDDYDKECQKGRYPLVGAIHEEIFGEVYTKKYPWTSTFRRKEMFTSTTFAYQTGLTKPLIDTRVHDVSNGSKSNVLILKYYYVITILVSFINLHALLNNEQ